MTVIVLCDRGIASPKLWNQILAQGWHLYSWHPTCGIGRTSASAPRTVADCPLSASFPVPTRRGLAAEPLFSTPAAKRRCTLFGGLVRRAGRTMDHPHRPSARGGGSQLVRAALLDRTGLQGPQEPGPSRAWDGNGTRPAGPTRRVSPATGWCCRWPRCWPWPMAPGWRTPMTQDFPRQPADAAQGAGTQTPQPL